MGAASKALVPFGQPAFADDKAAAVLKPGILRRIMNPDFADVYDRVDVRIADLNGDGGSAAAEILTTELNSRRGLRAKVMGQAVALDLGDDPVANMSLLSRGAERWLLDNGADVLVWGDLPPPGKVMHLRFFARDQKPGDSFRVGDGWTMLALPIPLEPVGAHRLHAVVLSAIRSKSAGKVLTVRRDLGVLAGEVRDSLIQPVPGLSPRERAEDQAAVARALANFSLVKRRADDARAAIGLLQQALSVFTRERTPIEWAAAYRDCALLYQFIAERTNDSDALRRSVDAIKAALQVISREFMAADWAALKHRLGLALYRLDFQAGDMKLLEESLQAFDDALGYYDRKTSPLEWADSMSHFGQVALIIGREQRSPAILLRAVEAFNNTLHVRDRRVMPMNWAAGQNNLGSALFLYGRITGDQGALQGAYAAFTVARALYNEKGHERMAAIATKNLRHVEKALNRTSKSEPPALPWERRRDGDEPPALPWEIEAGQGKDGDSIVDEQFR
ncbi:MAG: hypothetical protein O2944_04445 [Proteobacteria bacterium]|nr:hypothetical protein [Pseudomonadota bacterium]